MQAAVSRAIGCFRSFRAKCRITCEKPRINIVIQCTVNRASGRFRSFRVKSRTVYDRSRAMSGSFPTHHVRDRRRARGRGLQSWCLESTFPEIRSSTFRQSNPTSDLELCLEPMCSKIEPNCERLEPTFPKSPRHSVRAIPGNAPPVFACRTCIASRTAPQRLDVAVLRKQPECYARRRAPQTKMIELFKFPPEIERTVPFRTPDLTLGLLASLDVDKR